MPGDSAQLPSPARQSLQWWTVLIAITASKLASSKGSDSALAAKQGTASSGRARRMVALGSTATTERSGGS
jgi:hypothetical protein